MNAKTEKWNLMSQFPGQLFSITGGHIITNFFRGGFHGILYFLILGLTIPVIQGVDLNYDGLWKIYGQYAACFFLYMALSMWSMTNSFVKSYSVSTEIRLRLGDKLRRLSLGFFKNHDPGDLTSRMLHDVEKSENTLSHAMPDLAASVILPVLLGVFLFVMNHTLGLIIVGVILSSSLFFFIARRIIAVYGKKQVKIINETAARILEYTRCIKLLKAHDMIGESFTTLNDSMKNLTKACFRTEVFTGIPVQLFLLFIDGGYFLMIFFAVKMFANGELGIPELFSFVVLGHYFFMPVKQLGINLIELRYALMSTSRIYEVMNTEELPYKKGREMPEKADIVFEDVHFRYKDNDVLKGMNCTIPEKKMTALVGLSGSGKTTMTSLIARFWETDSGDIKIGGVSIKDIEPDLLLSKISMVFQDVYLFNDTIEANIRVGRPDASKEEIREAARLACCSGFIEKLADGYDTVVGEGGNTLSGGEKQRISIARAILKDAPIVLLDEATASLDPENEAEIQEAIEHLVEDKTVVVIAHRFKSIENADQILVIDGGSISERGTHDELIESGGLYQKLWEEQQKSGTWKIRESA